MRELAAIEDELDLLEAIGQQANPKLPSFKVGGTGKKGSWDCDLAEFRARVREAGDGLAAVCAEVANACAHRLGSAIRAFTLESARARQREGQLEFHDLLVLARALLRDPDHGPAVRATLHDRYDRLLLDEFQDTDPIQIELAVRIAAADPRQRGGRHATRGTRSTWRPVTSSSSATPSSRSTASAGPTSPRSCGRPSASGPRAAAWSS